MADKASYLFSVMFTAIGMGLLIAGSLSVYRGISTSSWTIGRAVVTQSYGHPSVEHPGEIGRLDFEYQYQVGDSLMKSGRISYQMDMPVSKEYLLEQFPQGAFVKVYYNPAKPEMSVLFQGTSGTDFVLPAGGLVFLLTGIFIFRGEMKKRRKEVTVADKINQARKAAAVEPARMGIRTFKKEFAYPKYIANKGGAVFVVIMAIFVIGFPLTFSILFGEKKDIVPLAIGCGVFTVVGLFMILSSVNAVYSRIVIGFSGEVVEFRMNTLFRKVRFEEKIQDYAFVTPRYDMVKSQFGANKHRNYYLHTNAVLIHRRNPKRDIDVLIFVQPYYDSSGSRAEGSYRAGKLANELHLPFKNFN